MADIFAMTDTWNNAGTVFTALKMNVTDTASSAASMLMDLQVAGSSKLNLTKGGTLTAVQALVSNGHVYNGGAGAQFIFSGATRLAGAVNGDFSVQSQASVEQFAVRSGALVFRDGVTAPSATAGYVKMYVDTADGDLKVIFGDGTVKTLSVDT